ncbi:MAG: bifunctional aspartate kinase/homoserine dehydrogenase I [Flavobacterium sp.]|uniref:bifunctional aspartate kinase/homoserine dehydrogenase I n=1 Tax=Flavobacterium sp. TaxID=239 RepID=UPI001B75349B|nr:bifunctional aspartate kinase/homoserine dehydrogenase I [Flavobacterium sp.]MBP6145918.1 bifunctional aspartate kinase/homoserine dehydrogenase I [Flavobacterium sp.]MBP7181602.1 bifunctional aspartate kinase/homoserine dehydrogenase I [Flavobacterium sp.]MBP7316967.1 bifunctional aspartate kinase/homoserine dehydrogenase I [Flavobacterium sp.]HRL70386.1 bifunctional aspartate kinase/homoserine dehydrogenase I [Flavobacterium sp.]HRM46937.1 bifunctional aspartate kinase/homoserine dehydrog
MRVLKFGGSSVANAQNIKLVLDIVVNKAKEEKLIVVVSAFSKITDLLQLASQKAAAGDESFKEILADLETKHLDALKELIPVSEQSSLLSHIKRIINHLETLLDGCYLLGELSPRTSDTILSFGELLSSYIIAEALKQKLKNSSYKDSRELIKTNNSFGKAVVNFDVSNKLIVDFFASNENQVVVMPGFIAASLDGINTTLGRGGSDYTAAILAGALHANELEIWTDVNGMFTANPKIVKQAQPIVFISYQEAMELSHFGAKVLYPPTIQPVLRKNIPILIKNTFEPAADGTYISNQEMDHTNPVKGISHIDNITLITLEGSGMIGVSGSSKRLFEVLSNKNINVIFITQASSEHSICIGILNSDADVAEDAINKAFEVEISQNKIDPCIVEKNLCIIALVGENMKNHQGLSGRMFSTLGKNNVNIRAIAQGASERNISAVINERDVKKALNTLHENFFEENTKQLNLFVMGVGNVGEKFIEQIHQQKKFLKDNLKINLRVIALSNSRKMHFDEEGISLKEWQFALETGEPTDKEKFISNVKELNLRNSIFVDITANESVSKTYEHYLKRNIAVVTCNKIACASAYDNYTKLKKLSRQFNAPFLFETNVGAGLPIIDTVKNLVASGDKVNKIQAVLSGSLNFIFNNFDEKNTFHDVVKEAGVQGFTEPDPKIDLSGIDVARKILILIRESGYKMEIEEITNESFLPAACLDTTTNEAFFESLQTHAAHFEAIYKEALSKDSRLKYVAQFENGKANVGLRFIPKDHPFYNLEGKDNIVLFFTDRYIDQPLLIKGAGAGAEVTASGIFADVIRIGNV